MSNVAVLFLNFIALQGLPNETQQQSDDNVFTNRRPMDTTTSKFQACIHWVFCLMMLTIIRTLCKSLCSLCI